MRYIYFFISCLFISFTTYANIKKDSVVFNKLDQQFKLLLFNLPDSANKLALKQLDFAQTKKNNIWISEALNNIANSLYINNKLSKAEYYYQKNLKLQKEILYLEGLGKTYNNLGNVEKDRNNPIKAKEYYLKSIYYRKKLNDDIGRATAYLNLGILFDEEGNLPKALEYQFKALRIFEKSKENRQIAKVYNNIAILYKQQQKYKKALSYNFKSLEINKKQNLHYDEATSYNNIANIFVALNKLHEAIQNYEKALGIAKKLEDFQLYSMLENNLGVVYLKLKQFEIAQKYFERSYTTKVEIEDIVGQIEALENLGSLYSEKGKSQQSIYYCLKSYELAKKYELIQDLQVSCDCLYKGYKDLKQNDAAIKFLEEANKISDTLEKMNNERKLLEHEFEYNYEKKTYEDSLKNITQKQLLQTQIENEKTKKNSLYGGLFFVMIFTLVIYNRFKTSQKQRKIIETQKHLVEEKNKEILDSITYAKRIQSAILPSEKLIQYYFNDSFILYKPKDIVAGDFYWFEVIDDTIFFAAADCTGHGVPGAMVSVVCHNALNRSVKEYGLKKPGEILDKTREIVIAEFEKSDEDVKDGMDISLAALRLSADKQNENDEISSHSDSFSSLSWSGAHNPIWIVRNSEIIEFKADKQPIGKYSNSKPFTTHKIDLYKNDEIYLFTDGFQDQFGGVKGKKFKAAQMRELFLSLNSSSMTEKKGRINDSFEKWKGNLEQVDDVCIIGVRI